MSEPKLIDGTALAAELHELSGYYGGSFTGDGIRIALDAVKRTKTVDAPSADGDLISRIALLKKICGAECGCAPEECGFSEDEECENTKYITAAPAVQPEVKRGKWIEGMCGYYTCSGCGSYVMGKWDYCHDCGALMDEVSE